MTAVSETQINLTALKRVDSKIIEIIDNASQVALYKYEKKLEKWEGTDIEGSMFLYRRSVSPKNGFIIMNRMNTTNLVEPITSDMQLQLQQPYLLYKNHQGDIFGFWFYESRDLLRITKKIQKILLKQEAKPPRRQRCASESDSGGQDIMTLLSQAHLEYVKNSSSDETKSSSVVGAKEDEEQPLKLLEPSLFSKPVSPRKRFASGSWKPRKIADDDSFRLTEELTDGQVVPSSFLPTPSMFETVGKSLTPVYAPEDLARSPIYRDVGAMEVSLAKDHVFYSSDKSFTSSSVSLHLNGASDNNWSSSASVNMDASKKRSTNKFHDAHLKGAFLSVLQTDSDLMQRIHEAYVSSLRMHFCKAGKPTFFKTSHA